MHIYKSFYADAISPQLEAGALGGIKPHLVQRCAYYVKSSREVRYIDLGAALTVFHLDPSSIRAVLACAHLPAIDHTVVFIINMELLHIPGGTMHVSPITYGTLNLLIPSICSTMNHSNNLSCNSP